jgi:hypothetical protein
MSKPETTFVSSVHKYIPKREIHKEGMANPYRGGTPDNYYDATPWLGPESMKPEVQDLWVEYKFKPKIGLKLDLCNQASKPALSSLQMKWIRRRYSAGKNMWVICGFPEGGIIMKTPEEWARVWTKTEILAAMKSRREIANCVINFVLCRSEKPSK